MPRHTQEHKQFYKSKIRSLIAVDHNISRRELQERLDKQGLHLDLHYLCKLYDEIFFERTKRMDRRLLNETLSSFEDTMTEVVRVAWEIANDPYIRLRDPKATVMALKEIREVHNDVFEKLFDAGVFDRKRGSFGTHDPQHPAPGREEKGDPGSVRELGPVSAPKGG
jgi:hypothetical protein